MPRQIQLDITGSYEWRKILAAIPSNVPAELMMKKLKTHRCTMDFDHRFCQAIYKEDSADKYSH
jgi:hypothetical protein